MNTIRERMLRLALLRSGEGGEEIVDLLHASQRVVQHLVRSSSCHSPNAVESSGAVYETEGKQVVPLERYRTLLMSTLSTSEHTVDLEITRSSIPG